MMTLMGSPVAKCSKASLACASGNFLEISGFRSTLPLATRARAVGYRLQYLYTPMMSISRLEASCNRVGVTSGRFATTQTTPPELAALTQRSTAAGAPQHSKQTSNLSPAVLSMTASSSGSSARSGCSTPSSAAFRSFASTMSVMVTEAAPEALAHSAVSSPTGPAPLTKTRWPTPTFARVTACRATHMGSSRAPSSKETCGGNLWQ
mmetsp:Transcript_15166/g.43329  ORF Transcript_15166/g.43329 Transcript_15166/m.43329 type:complete len:207 (+) Transcript_15166:200-820(+)